MKGGSKFFLFAGVGLAMVAILLGVASFAGGSKSTAVEPQKPVKVRVIEVVRDVPAHTILNADDVIEREVNSTDAPAGSLSNVADVIGRSYQEPLVKGQWLKADLVELPGIENDLSAGMRAMSLPVNDVNSLAGLIRDGDYIDVVFSTRIDVLANVPGVEADVTPVAATSVEVTDNPAKSSESQPVAKLIIQNVRVLRAVAPGKRYDESGNLVEASDGSEMTSSSGETQGILILELTPLQAEVLGFMQVSAGSYHVVARAAGDHETVDTTGITYQVLTTDGTWSLPMPGSVPVAVTPEAGS